MRGAICRPLEREPELMHLFKQRLERWRSRSLRLCLGGGNNPQNKNHACHRSSVFRRAQGWKPIMIRLSCPDPDTYRVDWCTSTDRAFLVSLISTHPPDGALSRTSLRPRPRPQRSSASIASSYHDQCARARNIFILRCGTKDHVLLVPQSRQRINSGRSPCRHIASENRGA